MARLTRGLPGRWSDRVGPVRQQALSVSLATGAYGLSLGALAVAAGLDFWQTMVLSVLVFSGGSQFAFVGVIGAGGTPLAAVGTSALLGVRNGFYGVALAPILRPMRGWRFAWAAQVTIDESTAVALAQPETDDARRRVGFWWAGVGVFVAWNVLVGVGAIAGAYLGEPEAWGLDAAAAAAFLGLVWPRLAARKAQAVAAAAAVLALALTPVLPAGLPILAAAIIAIAAGWRDPTERPVPTEVQP
ncbi:AzlC family ABC transporter permease [Demequina sp. TTPB684]|uniref:AzlC family ABC transporter permease n=1 Tax=unclassified Demequina TaxID=2620311 RepID=UPI001CF16176|nr:MULTISPECIES: AzlC family ABC transporter permease [unclassified Demequina]MCB2413713.1 AzlC family ABC transporter permease [Demequina sp. TTPB684]UPU89614.1 AzlC family ABC transporter permease [Demequina sp. TMPB413]